MPPVSLSFAVLVVGLGAFFSPRGCRSASDLLPLESAEPSPLSTSTLEALSQLNEALAALWPQISREDELVPLSEEEARRLSLAAVEVLRGRGRSVSSSALSDLLQWHLTSCYSSAGRAGGLAGVDGLFELTANTVCPGGRGFSCAVSSLSLPSDPRERSPRQALAAAMCAAATRLLGSEAAAAVSGLEAAAWEQQTVELLALERSGIQQTDRLTKELFLNGVKSQLQLQHTFRDIQWNRFVKFHKMAAAFRLAGRLFFEPGEKETPSASQRKGNTLTFEHLQHLLLCVSDSPCLGVGTAGFKETAIRCIKERGLQDAKNPLHRFFVGSPMNRQDSIITQMFASAFPDSIFKFRHLNEEEGGGRTRKRTVSGFQIAIRRSMQNCSAAASKSFKGHLMALRAAQEMRNSPALTAAIAIENAPLLFHLNAISLPQKIQQEYQTLRASGASLGLAFVRGGAEMIATACGSDRCGSPSPSFLNCVAKSLEAVSWKAQRELLKQHMEPLVYLARDLSVLPPAGSVNEVLPHFAAALLQLMESLKGEAVVSKGTLRVWLAGVSSLEAALDALFSSIEEHLLPMSISFAEDGELSLYGNKLQQRPQKASSISTCVPPRTGSGAFKSFLIMQRLKGHFNELIGNKTLKEAYGIISKKAGLSPRAVEATFVRSHARELFIYILSLSNKHTETAVARLQTAEQLLSFIVDEMAGKLTNKQEEETSAFGLRVAGEVVAFASAVQKEVLRSFAKQITLGAEFKSTFEGRAGSSSVVEWQKERFTDFRKDIYPSYLIDAAFDCLHDCINPLLADKRLQTGCTDDKGRPQPLIKCADPAEEFRKGMRKNMWEELLSGWLAKGKAHPACQHLLSLQKEDENAWTHQVGLMSAHLDTINCGKDHHGYDSYNRFAIKLKMISILFDMFAKSKKEGEEATMPDFIEWLVQLRLPLPQNLQTPTSDAILTAGLQPHTQVSVGRAFKMAVREDPSFAQCKPEDTRIISELIPSLSSLFYTLRELDDFLSQQKKQEDSVTRLPAAPPAADARPTLQQVMTKYTASPKGYPETIIQIPFYFPTKGMRDSSSVHPSVTQALAFAHFFMKGFLTSHLAAAAEPPSKHLIQVAADAISWSNRSLHACGKACTVQSEGERAFSVALGAAVTNLYAFPATREEHVTALIFNWQLPVLPPLNCQQPEQSRSAALLPPLLPLPGAGAAGGAEGGGGPEAEEGAQEGAPGEEAPAFEPPAAEEQVKLKKHADQDATDPEELLTALPTEVETGPKLDPKDDACQALMRLYYKYIEGSEYKDVDKLYEEAKKIPLFAHTRGELNIPESVVSLQTFRLVVCVTCAKHIPALQKANKEEKERLLASLESSKELCNDIYSKTGWAEEMEGGVPITAATRNLCACMHACVWCLLPAAAELSALFTSSSVVGGTRLPPSSLSGGLSNWIQLDKGLSVWAQQAKQKLKTDASVAALCVSLRYSEFLKQITKPGEAFDRLLVQWSASLPSSPLRYVNALRSAAGRKDKLTQELCTLSPPGPEVQTLVARFDPFEWASLMLQTETQETAQGAAPETASSSSSNSHSSSSSSRASSTIQKLRRMKAFEALF
ncbi:hypothetical protein Efla_000082 [Eimeria flavescens]